jgi:hypothetical protein
MSFEGFERHRQPKSALLVQRVVVPIALIRTMLLRGFATAGL